MRIRKSNSQLFTSILIGAYCVVGSGFIGCAQDSPPPPPPQEQARPADVEHRVSYSGETLALIASWYTGKGTNWSAIRAANPGLRPERMTLGQTVIIPGYLVVERDPMPKKFIQDNLAKSRRTSKTSDTADTTGTEPTPTGTTTTASGDTPLTGGTVTDPVAPADQPKGNSDEVNLDALLNEQIAAEANKNKTGETGTAADKDAGTAGANAAAGNAGAPKVDAPTAPSKVGDQEREQLLDELLTQ